MSGNYLDFCSAGEPMEFATFEDQTGLYDATFFPGTYRQYCHLLSPNQPFLVTGIVQEHFATVTLTVNQLRLLSSQEWEGCGRST